MANEAERTFQVSSSQKAVVPSLHLTGFDQFQRSADKSKIPIIAKNLWMDDF